MASEAVLIRNGKDDPDEALAEALERAAEAGYTVTVRETAEEGDARRFAREAAESGVRTVIAGGGDGTLHEVVAGLVTANADAAPALGILPLGTANDFATTLGVPDDLTEALAFALTGPVHEVDVGWVGDQPVVNMATGGFGTEVTLATPEGLKDKLGRLSYLLTGLAKVKEFRAQPVAVRVDGDEWRGSIIAVAVGNGCRAGGAVQFCPEARIDDGLLDLTLVPGEGEGAGDALLQLLESGTDWFADAVRFRSPWVEIEAPGGLAWNLDGEPFEAKTLRFEVRRHALRLRAPDDSSLLQKAP